MKHKNLLSIKDFDTLHKPKKVTKRTGTSKDVLNEDINQDGIERVVRISLENMYMFGGNPRPDPNYEKYLNSMIKSIMFEINKTNKD